MRFLRELYSLLMLISVFSSGISNPIHLLAGNETDYCYAEPYISKRVECLEPLIYLYYGEFLATNCPNIVNWIATGKCKGCPWSRVNATAITPTYASTLDRSKLFHPAEPSCSVSEHLTTVSNNKNFLMWSFFGFSVPLFCATFLGMSDFKGSPTTPLLFGSRMKEPCYFILLWVVFFVGYGISIAGNELHAMCEGLLSSTSLLIGDWINLAVMLWTSWRRCRYLEARDRPEEVKSWALYRRSNLYRESAFWQKRIVDFVCWSGPVLILISLLYNKEATYESLSVCRMGSYRFVGYGLIQYSKIVLVILASGMYSLGPPRSLLLFYVRYVLLIVVLLLSIFLLFVMRLPIYKPQCISALIPRLTDCLIAGPTHAELIAHSIATALLGLAEPLRLGWPKLDEQHQKFNSEYSEDLT